MRQRPRKAPARKGRRYRIQWAYLTRAGSEGDLVTELGPKVDAKIVGEGVVLAATRPKGPDGTRPALAFARQAMATDARAHPTTVEAVSEALAEAIVLGLGRELRRWTLQVVAPDSRTPRDPRRRVRKALDEALAAAIEPKLPREIADAYVEADEAERIAQVWIVDGERALVGLTPATEAISRHPGGRPAKTEEAMPSPIARKLKEAEDWLGDGPGRGEDVVCLGAPSRGWASRAAAAGARVRAVDDKPFGTLPRAVTVVAEGPFRYAPDETVDWVLVVLGHRPLEVVKLLSKWGRRVWAQQFLANLLLPMGKKAEFLKEALEQLEAAGWRGVSARQLVSDKDEVTVSGWLDPALVKLGRKDPFQLRQVTGRRDRLDRKRLRPKKKRKVTTKNRPPPG